MSAALEIANLAWEPAAGLGVTAEPFAATGEVRLGLSGSEPELGARLAATEARFAVRDSRLDPPRTIVVSEADIVATLDEGGTGAGLNLAGRLADAGEASLMIRWPPGADAAPAVSVRADDVPATLLSAYAAAALGRGLATGDADLGLEFSGNAGGVDGVLRLALRDPVLAGQSPASGDEASLELAIALLEDADGLVEIELPFTGAGGVRDIVLGALKARIAAMAQAPFATLAELTGSQRNSPSIPFAPGDAALGEEASQSIVRLAGSLIARPRLGIRIPAAHDPSADRDALARQQIELHVQLATAGPGTRGGPAPVDAGSARVQDVLDEFAGERLPAGRLAAIASRYECGDDPACRRRYYEQIFEALVANEAIAITALNRLGRFRAQSVAQALAQQGIVEGRIEIGGNEPVAATPSRVELPLELFAF